MMKEFFSDAGYAVFDTLPIIKGISEKLTEYQETEPAEQLRIYLDTLFDGMDPVDIVIDGSYDDKYSKWKPKGKGLIEYAGRVKLARIERDQAYNAERGVWIRCNPCRHEPNCVTRTPNRKGKIPYGVEDEDITFFRYCLIEFDNMPREDQIEVVTRMQLPIATLTDSGGKSVHALIRLTAATEDEYRNKVGRLHDYLHRFGLQQDTANINPSRLTRLPGVRRGPEMQRLIGTNLGLRDLDEWFDFIGPYLGQLPEPEGGKKSSGADHGYRRYHLPQKRLGEGERHAAFYSLIGSFWSRAVPDDVIRWAMQHFNTDFSIEPKDPEVVEADVTDLINRYEFGTARRREIVDINGIPPMVFDHTSNVEPDDPAKKHFHSYSEKGLLNGVYDSKIAEAVIQGTHAFNFKGKLYLYNNGVYEMDTMKGSRFQTIAAKFLFEKYRTADHKRKIYEYALTDASIIVDEEDLNRFPRPFCVNFQNTVLDLETMDQFAPSPDYRALNQLPQTWPPLEPMDDDPIMHDYLQNILPDPDTREMVLQFMAYMMTVDRSLQKCLILRGEGGCGKSELITLANDYIIGKKNTCNMTLQKLNERFAAASLLGKLANIYADLPSASMSEVNVMKTITGGDSVTGEHKAGEIFSFHAYAKLMFSANQIPKSEDDKTSAYYRRLLIAPIPNREDQRELPNLHDRLIAHVSDLLIAVVAAGHRMLTSGFCESDESKREVDLLYMESDTVKAWMNDTNAVTIDEDGEPVKAIYRGDLYNDYYKYCIYEGRQALSKNGFYPNLREKNIPAVIIHGQTYFRLRYDPYPADGEDDAAELND